MCRFVTIAVLVFAATAVPAAGGSSAITTGTLNLQAELRFVSVPTVCPPGVSESVVCHARTGEGLVAGLGRVTETYVFMADPTAASCPSGTAKVLAYSVRWGVAGKGDLDLAVAEKPECVAFIDVPSASPQAFTVTGGTGAYVGASGSGTVTRVAGSPGPRVRGTDTWTGTITVPGLEFDVTPPMLSGARSRTVRAPRRAKRVRVRYEVSATDNVDVSVAVSCRPVSGSRFRIGRTGVTCSATDASGNTATARFTVTVKRRR